MRLLLLAVTAAVIKIATPALGVELTWVQAIIITILAQLFAFMFAGTQSVNIGVIKTKEDGE